MNRAVVVLMVVVAVLTGCQFGGLPTTPGASAPEHVPAGTLDAATARTKLAELPLTAPGPLTGYERSCDQAAACVFGRPWKDTDGDGCDQRSQVLARDLVDVVRKPGRCAVTAGTLHDPYTGKNIKLSKVQIDHVVPLAEMWRSGAATWPLEQRVAAANNLGNLLAVEGKTNQSKSDKTPDQWMPPVTTFHCEYARIYITTKANLQLTVAPVERVALEGALATC